MTTCPKCSSASGDDWSQCGGDCPMPMSPHYDPAKQHERERSEHDAIRALLAANAVLASTLRAYYEAERAEGQNGGPTFGEWQQILTRVEEALSQPHPGAALLSEMEALRKRVAELERHSMDMRAECAEWEEKFNDAGAQVATARAAALEEAARKAFNGACRTCMTPIHWDPTYGEGREGGWVHTTRSAATLGCIAEPHGSPGIAADIRALATTPHPPVVPMAKVREVLHLLRDHKTLGDRWTCNEVAQRLGISLDGET